MILGRSSLVRKRLGPMRRQSVVFVFYCCVEQVLQVGLQHNKSNCILRKIPMGKADFPFARIGQATSHLSNSIPTSIQYVPRRLCLFFSSYTKKFVR